MANERLTYLLEQARLRQASTAEFDELLGLIRLDDDGEVVRQIAEFHGPGQLAQGSVFTDAERDAMFDEIIRADKVAEDGEAPAVPVHRVHFLRGSRWWVAAAAIFLLAVGAYLLLNKQTPSPIVAKTDIQPGRNGAILTIGNKTVVLDTAQNGKLQLQTATDVTKGDSSVSVKGTTVEYAVLTTPRGRQEQLTLADGTKVWLNAASSIRFPTAFTGKERIVEITGEAYFEVVHNAKQPFHVKVKGLDIEDVGTHFNINAYDDEPAVKTTLLEGAVKMGTLTLQPGQQAELNNAGKLQLNKDIDLEQVMAWKNGVFRFSGTNITAIMRQVSRWYDVNIEYKGDVSQLDFSGYVGRKENVSKVLAILEATGAIHFTIEDKKIIVSP